jgi:fructosamine-3-kinase
LPVVEEQLPLYSRPTSGGDALADRLTSGGEALADRLTSGGEALADRLTSGGEALAERPASWGDALADLVLRRATASRQLLEADVTEFDGLVDRVVNRLREVVVAEPSIVHGDICQPNVLVEEAGGIAVLDWGFLTTAGDNTFDAATAAGFFDMYGPDAERIDSELLDRFEKLGHSRERMELYRLAYALITATIYSPATRDGHYHWCLRNLMRFR